MNAISAGLIDVAERVDLYTIRQPCVDVGEYSFVLKDLGSGIHIELVTANSPVCET